MKATLSVGIVGAGPGGIILGILLARAGFRDFTSFLDKVDQWMQCTVWTTQCSNYFRAANGRVVTQWPRSARAFWDLTRRFRSADFTFAGPAECVPDASMALDKSSR